MLLYFIGGSRDLTKQKVAVPANARPARELVFMAQGHDRHTALREYYYYAGKINSYPWQEEVYVYGFVRSETLKLEAGEPA
jgi:hypothetical protein